MAELVLMLGVGGPAGEIFAFCEIKCFILLPRRNGTVAPFCEQASLGALCYRWQHCCALWCDLSVPWCDAEPVG